MSEQTPTNLSNADFTFKDKYGNTSLVKGTSGSDSTKLNNMVKLMNLMLNTPNSTDFINTLATKQYVDENQSSGLNLFDVVAKDHVLTYGNDLEGFAPLGTWVYKTAVDGSRYGYPDFVQKCLDEYDEAIADTITFDNVTLDIKRHSNGHIYFDVADIETVNTYFNTYGHAWFYGIDKTNERVFLPRQAHGKLIESYKNGSDWYRIYEDGFCEQGGVVAYSSYGYLTSVSLLKEYTSSDYALLATARTSSGGSDLGVMTYTCNKVNDSFSIGTASKVANPLSCIDLSWQTCGYVNISELEHKPLYEYMVVGNVKVEQASTDVIDVTTTNNDTVPLFAPHYFDYTPNNLSWLKGGAQSNSGDLYKTCYNELVNVLNGETKYGSLKVIDESDMVSGTDYSLYWIVNQTNETFRTPTKTQQRFVVKTYKNGTDWYRIYNDGWCEQGGYASPNGTNPRTLPLLKPYLSNDYFISINRLYGSNVGANYPYIEAYNLTSNTFEVGLTEFSLVWYACGYIDLTNETFDTSLYFKVANAVENMELLDVSKVTEVLTSKADATLANASNIAQSFKDMSIGWGMPDFSKTIDISSSVTTSSTQLRSYPYALYLFIAATDTNVAGGSIQFLCNGTQLGVQGENYSTGCLLIPIPANTDFKLWSPIVPQSRRALIIPCKEAENV